MEIMHFIAISFSFANPSVSQDHVCTSPIQYSLPTSVSPTLFTVTDGN